MPNFSTLEPAMIPQGKPTFLLDWELTMRCNLDCSYCTAGTYGGHDNNTAHPELESCLRTIDFMLEYADLYMQKKAKWSREVILNVYGGESLFHPHISEIHSAIKDRHSKYDWPMTVTTTTNLTVGKNLLERIIPHIDEFTASYHTESTAKQKQMFRDNLITIRDAGKGLKVIILLHPANWADSMEMIGFCKQEGIRYLPRQLDHDPGDTRFNYTAEQLEWFGNLYKKDVTDTVDGDLASTGRACCGGRKMCCNQDYKNRETYILGNNFRGWSCAVNWFFVYIKQLTGEVFVNKDCKMNYDGTVGPIGHLSDSERMLDVLRKGNPPVIVCDKNRCYCGLCAPKAEIRELFDEIMPKYTTSWRSAGS
jgi:MoaA/NifB/PqqE/SkfB family radical SAM enzyme